jgi:hypothetical protein
MINLLKKKKIQPKRRRHQLMERKILMRVTMMIPVMTKVMMILTQVKKARKHQNLRKVPRALSHLSQPSQRRVPSQRNRPQKEKKLLKKRKILMIVMIAMIPAIQMKIVMKAKKVRKQQSLKRVPRATSP